jgi:hypothetical protein
MSQPEADETPDVVVVGNAPGDASSSDEADTTISDRLFALQVPEIEQVPVLFTFVSLTPFLFFSLDGTAFFYSSTDGRGHPVKIQCS